VGRYGRVGDGGGGGVGSGNILMETGEEVWKVEQSGWTRKGIKSGLLKKIKLKNKKKLHC